MRPEIPPLADVAVGHAPRRGVPSSGLTSPLPLSREAARDRGCSLAEMTDGEFSYVRALAQDYLEHVLQPTPPGTQPGTVAGLLRDVALSVQEEVETSLQLCLDSLDVRSVDAARTLFRAVMQKEFEDGVVNWGRIVTVFAFEGILVKKLFGAQADADGAQRDAAADAEAYQEISHFVAEFITTHTGEWIRQNGGWENGFVKKFETKCHRLTFLEVIGKVCKMFSLLKQYY
ncbi:bcl-2-related protein A1 [Sturnira hondurensis]|uniref:bcl-2-related protein A1 n=1 Tax=Sturnira hondurensis TaxID=192404 RepID=UPI00187A086E|nr:bcl-2-related protein A1 [Sturnira hondurensis]